MLKFTVSVNLNMTFSHQMFTVQSGKVVDLLLFQIAHVRTLTSDSCF